MTVAAHTVSEKARPLQTWLVVWAAALAAVLVLFLARDQISWAVNYPADAVVPVANWVSAIMTWLKINLSWLTRSITAILGVPLDFALEVSSDRGRCVLRFPGHSQLFSLGDLRDFTRPVYVLTSIQKVAELAS